MSETILEKCAKAAFEADSAEAERWDGFALPYNDEMKAIYIRSIRAVLETLRDNVTDDMNAMGEICFSMLSKEKVSRPIEGSFSAMINAALNERGEG